MRIERRLHQFYHLKLKMILIAIAAMMFLIGCKQKEQQTIVDNTNTKEQIEENIPEEEPRDEEINMLEGVQDETVSNKDYSDLEELLQTLKRETEKDSKN